MVRVIASVLGENATVTLLSVAPDQVGSREVAEIWKFVCSHEVRSGWGAGCRSAAGSGCCRTRRSPAGSAGQLDLGIAMTWNLHWLEASGDLRPWRETIIAEVEIARQAIAGLMPPTNLDILIERQPGAVIPETGTTGRAYRGNLFSISLDPDNPNFARSLSDGDLRRTVAHEAHHCMRMAGPGYGWTLGEALVSEGLAGQFVSRLFGSPPEPWECAVTDEVIAANLPDNATLIGNGHDHRVWFFGFKGERPRWLGYTLGYRIAGDWLNAQAKVDGVTWVNVPAHEVIKAACGRTLSNL
ncbi:MULTISPECIES: DUF2268 domain-containing putative Zn-dependent protease [unclassified Methylobacterium]|uniref:DUF2268 domain-containing putative Zn-dependent protease n=1 Tax=unclassified Methylobacterium TaxID=2615210 RepID=UPI0036F69D16